MSGGGGSRTLVSRKKAIALTSHMFSTDNLEGKPVICTVGN